MAADMPLCYHGAISKKDCEELMGKKNKDGAYLIRDSETFQGAMCLCVYKKHVVYTYRLLKTLQGQYTLLTSGGAQEMYFKSLDDLIQHYKRKNQGLVMHLRHSIKRKTALLIRATTQCHIQNQAQRPVQMPSRSPDHRLDHRTVQSPPQSPPQRPAPRPDERPAPRSEQRSAQSPSQSPPQRPAPRPDERPAPRSEQRSAQSPSQSPSQRPAPRPDPRPDPRLDQRPVPRPDPRLDQRPVPGPDPRPAQEIGDLRSELNQEKRKGQTQTNYSYPGPVQQVQHEEVDYENVPDYVEVEPS